MAVQTKKTKQELVFETCGQWVRFLDIGLVGCPPPLKIATGRLDAPLLNLRQVKNVHKWLGEWIARHEKGTD